MIQPNQVKMEQARRASWIRSDLPSFPETGKKRRRQLSAETKHTIFLEASRGDVPVAEVLRKYGIHSSELQRIREQVRLGAVKELNGKSRALAPPATTRGAAALDGGEGAARTNVAGMEDRAPAPKKKTS